MSGLSSHLLVVPIALPLVTAALLLLFGDRRGLQSRVNIAATLAGLLVAIEILRRCDRQGTPEAIGVYLASNWQAPFGIALVADRFSALMLVLVGIVSLASAVYAAGGWSRAGVYFGPLFQIQLMGLNGAFLTGDLFNLFVFFEVMLAASYGLQLHGSGWLRVRSGMHYIVVNLLASSLFLVGLAVLYGVTGTLSMADIADKFPSVPAVDRGLLHAGVAILAVAFLVKAAIWPLNAWLVPAYTATSAPVAALFALMTKVGIYALVRLWTLFFAPGADPSGQFGGSVLVCGGVLTMAFATHGLIASMRVGRIAAFSIILSSGTLLAAFALGTVSVTSAALFYLLSGTLAASALFLLVELVERIGSGSRSTLPDVEVDEDTNLDDEESPLVGRAFPISITFLGLSFAVCAVLVVGLPPLSGFVAKFALLDAIVGVGSAGWWIAGGLLVSGLAGTISLSRAGIRHFWAIGSSHAPKVAVVEAVSVFGLLLSAILLTVSAEPVLRYTRATAVGLHSPRPYVDAVLSAKPRTKGSP